MKIPAGWQRLRKGEKPLIGDLRFFPRNEANGIPEGWATVRTNGVGPVKGKEQYFRRVRARRKP